MVELAAEVKMVELTVVAELGIIVTCQFQILAEDMGLGMKIKQ